MSRAMILSLLISLMAFVACQREAPPADVPATPVAEAPADARFETLMAAARAENVHSRPLGQIVQWVGERLRGTPYVAGVLDAPAEETLVAPLDKFDCVLFVESALALARGIGAQDYSYDGYLRRVEQQRYRGGTLNGYCSRLHYFSEWIRDGEQRGLVENVTQQLGGIRLDKRLDFMSNHRDAYRQLTSDSLFAGIVEMERDLESLEVYYIPEGRLRSVYSRLQAGDIIATATDIEGLDVTHTGFVFDAGNGRKGFLHASTKDGVTVAPDLQTYLEGNRRQIGAVVVRPKA